jgi:hypothetical protein
LPKRTYIETFDRGPGGWFNITDNFAGPRKLEYRPGTVTSRSPWWVDYNHAPPGAGYLHMLYVLPTRGPFGEAVMEMGGDNRFVADGFSTNFRGARVSVRWKGELETRGAQPVLLLQTVSGGLCSGWACTGRPLRVTPEWTEQSLVVEPEPRLWTCLRGRHDRVGYYGEIALDKVLGDVNCNLMLILFPLDVAPMGPIDGDAHRLRADRDYPVWRSRLPEGYVVLDEVRIEFADADAVPAAKTSENS